MIFQSGSFGCLAFHEGNQSQMDLWIEKSLFISSFLFKEIFGFLLIIVSDL